MVDLYMTKRAKLLILLICALCTVAMCALPIFADETTEDTFPVENPTETPSAPYPVSFIVMKSESSKTIYMEGEYFSNANFFGKVTMSDSSEQWLLSSSDLPYLQTEALTPANTYITFTYGDLYYNFPITVIENVYTPSIQSIELSATKTDFLALETIDPSVFSAGIIYTDGTTAPLDLSLCTFFPALDEPVSAYTKSYTVTYTDGTSTYTDSISVSVSPIILLEVSGLENVKLYESTPYAPPTGLTVTAYYDGMKTVSQVITNYDIESDTELVVANADGKAKITIKADSASLEAEVSVLPIVNYSVSGLKSAYYYGDSFSAADVKVTALYSDLTSYDVTEQVLITAPETIVAGSTITAIHNGFDLKDFLNTSLPTGTLTVITEPTKKHYEIGEVFDSTGLELGINYSDGTRMLLNAGEYELVVSSPLTAADKLVSINYYGVSASVSISVGDEAYIVSLQLIGVPDVMTYYEGNLLNTSGVIIEAYMSDGSKLIVDPRILTFTPSLDTPLTTDITSVRISANDGTDKYCECSFPITVTKKVPTGLIATSKPTKLEYAEGEAFNPDGLALSLFFNDGSSIPLSSFTFSPELGTGIMLHSNATEKCIVYAVYNHEGEEFTYPIEITVTPAEIENLVVTRQPIKTVYEIGEEFIPMGVELMLIYKDRSLQAQVVPEGYYTYSPAVITAETREIVFTFRGHSIALPITVNGGVTSDITTQPIDPPITAEPPITDTTTENTDNTTEGDVTTEPEGSTDITTEITTEPESPSSTPDITSSPDNTTEEENTTGDSQGGEEKNPSSLLYLWIIVIVIIIAALIALIIYYKKNFT